jgi:hypothetical protein
MLATLNPRKPPRLRSRLKTAMKNRNPALNVPLDLYRPRWGRLQERALYCLIDGHGEASTRAIAAYCTSSKSKSKTFSD